MATSTGGVNPQPVENSAQPEGKVRDIVAEKLGIGGKKKLAICTIHQPKFC